MRESGGSEARGREDRARDSPSADQVRKGVRGGGGSEARGHEGVPGARERGREVSGREDREKFGDEEERERGG